MGLGRSITVNVNFDRPSSFYYAGEKITGTISLKNTHKKLTLKKAFLEFIGEFGYVTHDIHYYHDGTGYLQMDDCREYHRIPFINIRHPIVHPKANEVKKFEYRSNNEFCYMFFIVLVA
jgi:hypothetical protein